MRLAGWKSFLVTRGQVWPFYGDVKLISDWGAGGVKGTRVGRAGGDDGGELDGDSQGIIRSVDAMSSRLKSIGFFPFAR